MRLFNIQLQTKKFAWFDIWLWYSAPQFKFHFLVIVRFIFVWKWIKNKNKNCISWAIYFLSQFTSLLFTFRLFCLRPVSALQNSIGYFFISIYWMSGRVLTVECACHLNIFFLIGVLFSRIYFSCCNFPFSHLSIKFYSNQRPHCWVCLVFFWFVCENLLQMTNFQHAMWLISHISPEYLGSESSLAI